jgi:hypothetical protein
MSSPITAQPLTASSLAAVLSTTDAKIVAALNRNTAALLTVAAELLAASTANHGMTSTPDQITQEIRDMFNRLLI